MGGLSRDKGESDNPRSSALRRGRSACRVSIGFGYCLMVKSVGRQGVSAPVAAVASNAGPDAGKKDDDGDDDDHDLPS
jgi:hypothetical protein